MESREFVISPLWSYAALYHTFNINLLIQDIMNIIAFLPVGFLLGIIKNKTKVWRIIYIGIALSGSIEVMQFLFKRGVAEFDDVIHNTLGCLIGYGLYSIIKTGFENFNKKYVKSF